MCLETHKAFAMLPVPFFPLVSLWHCHVFHSFLKTQISNLIKITWRFLFCRWPANEAGKHQRSCVLWRLISVWLHTAHGKTSWSSCSSYLFCFYNCETLSCSLLRHHSLSRLSEWKYFMLPFCVLKLLLICRGFPGLVSKENKHLALAVWQIAKQND